LTSSFRFFNIIVSIADIYREGAAGTLGKKVLHFYFLTTMFAVTNGCIVATAFSSLLSNNSDDDDDGGVDIELLCPKSFGKLSVLPSGVIQCIPTTETNVTSYEKFSLIDSEDALINDAITDRSFLDQILSTFDSLVPNNVIQSFAVANIISIIVIGLVFGVAMTHVMSAHEDYRNTVPVVKPSGEQGGEGGSYKSNGEIPSGLDEGNGRTANPKVFAPGAVFDFCREMSLICNLIIQWIVKLAPYCIAFLIAGSLSQAGSSSSSSPPHLLAPWLNSLRQSHLLAQERWDLLHLFLCWDPHPSLHQLAFDLLLLHWREPLPLDVRLSQSYARCLVHCLECESFPPPPIPHVSPLCSLRSLGCHLAHLHRVCGGGWDLPFLGKCCPTNGRQCQHGRISHLLPLRHLILGELHQYPGHHVALHLGQHRPLQQSRLCRGGSCP
jgi:hypothetical protein